jgi:ribose transport system ATP-binding protein
VSAPLLVARGLSKRFGGVQALDQVDFDLHAGEIHVLLGENGAGKSTLVKLIAGVEQPDAGEIRLDGRPVHFAGPAAAQRHGIAVIHQEFNLLPNLTVGQNIYLGHEPRRGWRIDWPRLYAGAEAVLGQLGLTLPVRAPLHTLDVGEQQMVAIARALSREARLLILDEPTAALNERETERLFDTLRRLRAAGVGILYISHRLQELSRIGDRATVLRDGRLVGTVPLPDTPLSTLIEMMIGRVVEDTRRSALTERGPVVLATEALTQPGAFAEVSIRVHAGEIVGLYGLMGAGQEAFARALFGLAGRAVGGALHLFGQPVLPRTPAEAMRHGVAFVPPDRKQAGLCLQLPIRENVVHASLRRLFPHWLLTARAERRLAAPYLAQLRVVMRSGDQPVTELSGGNQQKVALAKWLLTRARIYLLMEPTRGVDVGTKAEIHALIATLAQQGAGILLVTSDLPELTALSDRLYVFRAGQVVAELPRAEISQERVLAIAAAGNVHHVA